MKRLFISRKERLKMFIINLMLRFLEYAVDRIAIAFGIATVTFAMGAFWFFRNIPLPQTPEAQALLRGEVEVLADILVQMILVETFLLMYILVRIIWNFLDRHLHVEVHLKKS